MMQTSSALFFFLTFQAGAFAPHAPRGASFLEVHGVANATAAAEQAKQVEEPGHLDQMLEHTEKVTHGARKWMSKAPELIVKPTEPLEGARMLLFVFAVCVSAVTMSGYYQWVHTYEFDEDKEAVKTSKQIKMKLLADQGDLEFFTCMALEMGRQKTWRSLGRFLPGLLLLIGLQVVLGWIMVGKQYSNQHLLPVSHDREYRLIGCMLYAYSAWHISTCMYDTGREHIVQMMLTRKMSGWYEWPVILGETINSFVSLILMVILYLVFCDSGRCQDLLVNSVAINFLADVDNSIVTGKDVSAAIKNFNAFAGEWRQAPKVNMLVRQALFLGAHDEEDLAEQDPLTASAEHEHLEEHPVTANAILMIMVLHLNKVARFLILLVGAFLSFLFAFANNEAMCLAVKESRMNRWPFCYSDPTVLA